MNNRQRFWKMVRFEEIDHLPFWADWLGPWRTWKKQGLPVGDDMADEKFREWCLDYFGFEGMYSEFWGMPRLPVEIGPCPPFEILVLKEKEDYKLVRQKMTGCDNL